MAFQFIASAQDNGIIFTYENRKKAIFVYREGSQIKEEMITYSEMVSKRQKVKDCLKFVAWAGLDTGALILIDMIMYLGANISLINLWIMYIIWAIFYTAHQVRNIMKEQKKYSVELKKYHSAEHMVLNSKGKALTTVQELKKFSNFNVNCGSNGSIIKIIKILVNGIASKIYLSYIINDTNGEEIILCIMYIITIVIISIAVDCINEKGLLNLVQSFYLETPDDEHLELAIYGLRRVKELDKSKVY